MKKFAMAVATASLLGGAYAESCASSVSGFYAGVQAGINSTNGTSSLTYTDTNAAHNTATTNTLGKKSFLGGIFAGYGMGVGSCAYVGGEFYVNFGNSNLNLINATTSAGTATLKASNKTAFGAKVRLGYTVSQQAMIFLGLGLEYSKWKVSGTVPTSAAATTLAVSKSKSGVKFAPSVGMDMFLNKNLFVRGEYTYVLSSKVKQTVKTTVGANTYTAAVKASPSQQRFALGLGYKF